MGKGEEGPLFLGAEVGGEAEKIVRLHRRGSGAWDAGWWLKDWGDGLELHPPSGGTDIIQVSVSPRL